MEIKSFSQLAELKKAGKEINLSQAEVAERAQEIATDTIAKIKADISLEELQLEVLENQYKIDPTAVKLAEAKYKAALADARAVRNNSRSELIGEYNKVGGRATPDSVREAMTLLISIKALDNTKLEDTGVVREAREYFNKSLKEPAAIVAQKRKIADLKVYLDQIEDAAALYLGESGE